MEPWIDGLWEPLGRVLLSVPGDGETEDAQKTENTPNSQNAPPTQLELNIDPVPTSSAIASDLASSLQGKLSVSSPSLSDTVAGEPLSSQHTKSSQQPSLSPLLGARSVEKGGQSSSTETTCTAVPSDVIGGSSGVKNGKEEAAARDELKTPSLELASTPLTLPSLPPLFIKVLLKSVSLNNQTTYTVHYNNRYCCVCCMHCILMIIL